MSGTGIVKDYTVDKTTYRYRGTTDDDYTIYIIRNMQEGPFTRAIEVDITDAAQHLFVDHPSPFHGVIWLVDCIQMFGDDVPIGGKI